MNSLEDESDKESVVIFLKYRNRDNSDGKQVAIIRGRMQEGTITSFLLEGAVEQLHDAYCMPLVRAKPRESADTVFSIYTVRAQTQFLISQDPISDLL